MFQLHFFISAIRNCLCKFSLNSCFTEDREPAAFHFLFWTNSLSLSHLSPLLHSITKYVYTKIETLIPFANKMKSKTLKSVLVCDGFFSSMEYFPVEKERSAIFKLQKWEKCSGIEFRKQVFSPDSKQLWHLWSKSNSFQTINVSRNWCGSQRLCIPIDGPLFFAHDTHTHFHFYDSIHGMPYSSEVCFRFPYNWKMAQSSDKFQFTFKIRCHFYFQAAIKPPDSIQNGIVRLTRPEICLVVEYLLSFQPWMVQECLSNIQFNELNGALHSFGQYFWKLNEYFAAEDVEF